MLSSPAEGDCLFIEAFETTALIGVYPHERQMPQPICIDLMIGCDLSRAAKSDRLADTIDYNCLVKTIASRLSDSTFGLLEALGEALCEDCLAAFPIDWVKIRLRKPGLFANAQAVGIQLSRQRHDNT